MNIFKRLRDITVASMNEWLDQLEDPVTMLNQYLRDMEREISNAEVAIARQAAMEKKWKNLVREMEARVQKRERQAQLAVDMGDDHIAREAIADKQYCHVKMEEYQAEYEAAKEQKRSLQEQLQVLRDKYDELKSKKYALMARANVASAKKQMNIAMTTIDTDSAAKGFSRIEERVMMLEADADASHRLRSTYAQDKMDQRLAWNDQVEQELTMLKSAKHASSEKTENHDTTSSLSEQ